MKHIESDVMWYKHRYTPLDGLLDVRDAADGRHSAENIAFILWLLVYVIHRDGNLHSILCKPISYNSMQVFCKEYII